MAFHIRSCADIEMLSCSFGIGGLALDLFTHSFPLLKNDRQAIALDCVVLCLPQWDNRVSCSHFDTAAMVLAICHLGVCYWIHHISKIFLICIISIQSGLLRAVSSRVAVAWIE
jgi:hypothetical protein